MAEHLLDSHRLGQVPREIHIETFANSKPISDKLQRNDVEKTLQTINSFWYLDLLRLRAWEFWVIGIADDDRPATTGDDCQQR